MVTQVVDEEDEGDFVDWTPVHSGRGRGKGKNRQDEGHLFASQGSKRGLEENSSDEGSGIVARKKIVREEF